MSKHPDRAGCYDYPFSKMTTEDASWTVGGTIPYMGSDAEGGIIGVSVICGKNGGNSQFSVRLYDKTNAKTIAEKTQQNVDYPTVLDLGTISNVPTGLSVLELHVKKTSGTSGKTVTLASAILEF